MKIALVRQRPSIGDCLLLSPVVRQLRNRYPESRISVITDPSYMSGALVDAFSLVPGIDDIERIPATEWTTESNKTIDPSLKISSEHSPTPPTIKKADLVLDANGAFMLYERQMHGRPTLGIAEFWLKHFDLHATSEDCLPVLQTLPAADNRADAWLQGSKNPVGVVLRSGARCRDWDYDGKSGRVCDFLHSAGHTPITFDPLKRPDCQHAKACIGLRLSEVASIIKRCQVILTPDTGLLHLAQGLGVPTVSLWGIMPPELRIKGYKSTPLPRISRGVCSDDRPGCECQWKFQRWSCMRRIHLSEICDTLIAALE